MTDEQITLPTVSKQEARIIAAMLSIARVMIENPESSEVVSMINPKIDGLTISAVSLMVYARRVSEVVAMPEEEFHSKMETSLKRIREFIANILETTDGEFVAQLRAKRVASATQS
jgi:hypothetical protein